MIAPGTAAGAGLDLAELFDVVRSGINSDHLLGGRTPDISGMKDRPPERRGIRER